MIEIFSNVLLPIFIISFLVFSFIRLFKLQPHTFKGKYLGNDMAATLDGHIVLLGRVYATTGEMENNKFYIFRKGWGSSEVGSPYGATLDE